MTCTRKKQCLYGDICPTARSDEYNLIDASCYKPLEQTNDEWRRTCSAEDFAKLLSDAMWYGEQCATEGVLCENCKCPWCEGIRNWLKQPHIKEKQDENY